MKPGSALPLIAVLLLAACHGEPSPGPPANAARRDQGIRGVPKRGPTQDELTAGMVEAVTVGKSTVPISLKFDLPGRPVVGRPLDIVIAMLPQVAGSATLAGFRIGWAATGARIGQDRHSVARADSGVPSDHFSDPNQRRRSVAESRLVVESRGRTDTRTFSVPIIALAQRRAGRVIVAGQPRRTTAAARGGHRASAACPQARIENSDFVTIRLYNGGFPGAYCDAETSQHRHHRARRSWQDHARRSASAPVRHARCAQGPAGARHGFERAGARARHHHSCEEHRHHLGRLRINIVDTPGHADFGGEVERVLAMVDCVLLLVDAVDGPMPQTRFVTQKAFKHGLRPIVVINKIDRDEARPGWVLDQTFDLFDRLGATDEQLDFPVVYASALRGFAGLDSDGPRRRHAAAVQDDRRSLPAARRRRGGLAAAAGHAARLFELRRRDRHRPHQARHAPKGHAGHGRRIATASSARERITQVLGFHGLTRVEVESACAGDIVAFAGIAEPKVSDTLCDPANVEPLAEPDRR